MGTNPLIACQLFFLNRMLPRVWHSLSDDATLVVRDGTGTCYVHPLPTWSQFRNDGDPGREQGRGEERLAGNGWRILPGQGEDAG